MNNAPIGIFDSGLGGLSVLRAIRALLPDESLIYCADSANAPYGGRTEAFITERSLAIGHWLIEQGAKALVVACNTATTNAIAAMREHFPVPIIGVEPGIKPAVLASRSGVAGVLATAATLQSTSFQRLVDEYAGDCRLLCTPGLGLVEAIETGDIDSPEIATLLRAYLEPMLDVGADTLALGCTHYPFLLPLIHQIVGDRLQVMDNSTPVARQLARRLETFDLLAGPAGRKTGETIHVANLANGAKTAKPVDAPLAEKIRLISTGDPTQLQKLAERTLGLCCHATTQNIPSRLKATSLIDADDRS